LSIVSPTIWNDLIKILEGIITSGADQVVSFYGLLPIILAVIMVIVGITLGIFMALKLVFGLTIGVAVVLFEVLSWRAFNSYIEKAYAAMPLVNQYALILLAILSLGLASHGFPHRTVSWMIPGVCTLPGSLILSLIIR
jgi:hypothetical protein